ncbi:glycosyltransferase family 2 protein [Flavihumibacter petaseus]|uniref:Putative glycosyltransferase n=1 Tax=Flavihumibacter petaseus NBRC 106054 TaxID=1220578 RepID=A0A0E9MX55_9BACT|nr:glycosyltransferase [Flavihumibacter petaseus]GAO41700.1 putative glycosyltransferase [Flavihumibacter petaseus NBRC 106054]
MQPEVSAIFAAVPDALLIDIAVPSFRLDERVLLAIAALETPSPFRSRVCVISDNPDVDIPESIFRLRDADTIDLIIHPRNLGIGAARNTALESGNGKWLLFLDDDIIPEKDLLFAYAAAIMQHPDAIGFAGVTDFPESFNAVTRALEINGTTGHFLAALHQPLQRWAPTANLLLNREKLQNRQFDTALRWSGEDMDFLVRNSLALQEKYHSVPGAIVHHPWWNNGQLQTGRLFRYGRGACQVARKNPLNRYTYLDFTNTPETLLLLLLVLPVAAMNDSALLVMLFMGAVLMAELLVNYIKAIIVGKTFSPQVALSLWWTKFSWECGYLLESLAVFPPRQFARRLDMGFRKENPSPFRLNRWKIIKLVLIVLLSSFAFWRFKML